MKLKRHPPGKFCVAARKASNALVSRRTAVVLVPRTRTSAFGCRRAKNRTQPCWSGPLPLVCSSVRNNTCALFLRQAQTLKPQCMRSVGSSLAAWARRKPYVVDRCQKPPEIFTFCNGISCMTDTSSCPPLACMAGQSWWN